MPQPRPSFLVLGISPNMNNHLIINRVTQRVALGDQEIRSWSTCLHLLLQIISFLYCAVFLFLFQYMSETQDLTINYDFIKNVSSSTDINEAASILQKITFDIFDKKFNFNTMI
jgi:hypothetical protein